MTQIVEPFPIFLDADGTPLENGMIYVGEANEDPRANPVQVYTDEALTVTIAQPIRTLAGRPAVQGSPVNLYIADNAYSISVSDRGGTLITSEQDVSRETQITNVNDFGARGDGVTDDTAALQRAFNADGIVLFTPGDTYRVTSALTVPAGAAVNLQGATILIDYSSTASAISFGANASLVNGTLSVPASVTQERILESAVGVCWKDLFITSSSQQNNRSDNQDAAVRIVSNRCHVENVRVVNFDNAFYQGGADYCTTINLSCQSYVRGFWSDDNDYSRLAGFVATVASPNAGLDPGHNGLLITQTRWSAFSDIRVINAGEHGIRIGGSTTHGSKALSFSNLFIEKPGQSGFKIRDTANRTTDLSISGLIVNDCSFGGGSSSNEDGLRIEKADHVMVTGLSVVPRDGGTSAYDGVHIYDSTDITIVTPRIEDVANDGVRITDSDGASETGVVNSIHIISPQIVQTVGNGITVSSPTETLRDIYATNVNIRGQTGWGISLATGSVTQPVQFTGIVNFEGSGIFTTNNNDTQLYVDLKRADNSFATNELTIASGSVTLPTRQAVGLYYIDTEGDAATDDLDTLAGGATYGQVVTLSAINDARTVVAKDGTGNLRLAGDFSMDNSQDKITLIFNGSEWFEIARSDNGA